MNGLNRWSQRPLLTQPCNLSLPLRDQRRGVLQRIIASSAAVTASDDDLDVTLSENLSAQISPRDAAALLKAIAEPLVA